MTINPRTRSGGVEYPARGNVFREIAAVSHRIRGESGRPGIGGRELGHLPVILGLGAIWIYFETQDSHFLTALNLSNLVLQVSVTATISIGVVLVLLAGEIDLSVGSVAGVCSALLGVVMANHGWPWWAAIAVMILSGAAIGVFQGAWRAFVGVPSFIVTLAGLLGWQGLQIHVLGINGTVNVFDSHIETIATTYLPSLWGWALGIAGTFLYAIVHAVRVMRRRQTGLLVQPVTALAGRVIAHAALVLGSVAVMNHASGVPTAGVIVVGLAIYFSWLTTRTRFGRHIFAVGGNAAAARRVGINLAWVRVAVFALAGTLSAIGGLLLVSRSAAAGTDTGGGPLLLEAIAAAVIGGTSLFGGRGSVWGAILGALVVGSVANGLDLVGQPADVTLMVEGAILLVAVSIDAAVRRQKA